jgi:ATP-dependent 26S proteasome regulatory subunit
VSSSSDTNTDEERFVKRKNKRMMIELSKMRPMNMDKKDVTNSIFRDRQKVGTSCADITPMEVDLKTSFESVGGSAEAINCLKEIVVLPLLYPEVFAKFNITPPRGGNKLNLKLCKIRLESNLISSENLIKLDVSCSALLK